MIIINVYVHAPRLVMISLIFFLDVFFLQSSAGREHRCRRSSLGVRSERRICLCLWQQLSRADRYQIESPFFSLQEKIFTIPFFIGAGSDAPPGNIHTPTQVPFLSKERIVKVTIQHPSRDRGGREREKIESKKARMNPSANQHSQRCPVHQVSCGAHHTLCLSEDGRVFSFGWNRFGQLGLGDTMDRKSPVVIEGIRERVTDISAGEEAKST